MKKLTFLSVILLSLTLGFFHFEKKSGTYAFEKEGIHPAYAKVGPDCTGQTFTEKRVEYPHEACWCSSIEEFVAKQNCYGSGTGCTEIKCGPSI